MHTARVLFQRISSSERYYFEVVKKSHRNEVTEFLNNNFRVEEPLSKAAGMTESDIQSCFEGVLDRALKNEVSILARFKQNDQIVGCMLNSVWRRGDAKKNEDVKEDFEFGGDRKGVITIGEILNELHESFWTLRPEEQTVLHFEISSVNKNHQRQGLASEFMNWTERTELLKPVEASGIVAEASSLANQILLAKRGYQTVSSILLNSKLDTSTGKPILICEDGTDRVNLVFKQF